jgi:AraC family transcriptional activator of pobA
VKKETSASPEAHKTTQAIKYSHNVFFQAFWQTFQFKILEHGVTEIDTFWQRKRDGLPYSRLHVSFGEGGALRDQYGETKFKPGLVVLTPFQTPCEQICKNRFTVFYIHFRLSSGPSVDLLSGLKKNIAYQLPMTEIKNLQQLLTKNSFSSALEVQIKLMSWLLPILQTNEASIKGQFGIASQYKEFFERLEKELCVGLSVTNLVSQFTSDVDKFSRHFKRDTGRTIVAQRNVMLIEKAQTELLMTDQSVKQVARHLGFQDELYFSRFFKKHTQRSPIEFRKLFSEIKEPTDILNQAKIKTL